MCVSPSLLRSRFSKGADLSALTIIVPPPFSYPVKRQALPIQLPPGLSLGLCQKRTPDGCRPRHSKEL